MTVSELMEKLMVCQKAGHGDTRVIAVCDFTVDGVRHTDYPVTYLTDVYYQSGDIELEFLDYKEYKHEYES